MFNNKVNKRGNIQDPIDAGFIMIGIILTLFFVWSFGDAFNDGLRARNETNYTQILDAHETINEGSVVAWDYGILLMAILFPVFSFIASRKIPTNPAMIVLTLLVIAFVFLAGMIIANLYGGMLENALFSTFVSKMIFVPIIIPNMLWYTIIYSFIVLIGLFGKEETA